MALRLVYWAMSNTAYLYFRLKRSKNRILCVPERHSWVKRTALLGKENEAPTPLRTALPTRENEALDARVPFGLEKGKKQLGNSEIAAKKNAER